MKELTDKTIEILCGECDQNFIRNWEVGIENMIRHIREAHPNYSAHEADAFATAWMEDAWDKIDLANERAADAYQHENATARFGGIDDSP